MEFFNLRVLRPLNLNKLYNSIKKTKKILTVDTGFIKHGIGAEIITSLVEKEIVKNLKVRRLGLPDFPTPSSRGLITNYYPSALNIIENCMNLIGVDKNKTAKIKKEFIKQDSTNFPIDIPHPSFKGPF